MKGVNTMVTKQKNKHYYAIVTAEYPNEVEDNILYPSLVEAKKEVERRYSSNEYDYDYKSGSLLIYEVIPKFKVEKTVSFIYNNI